MKGVKGESGTVDIRVGAPRESRRDFRLSNHREIESTGKALLIDTGQESVEKWH
ncbi:MAG: hypothetical protein LC775_14050 [Acidobacteria bacterium]|nr:hypothetical protein [Acidobacteriota bacterium]